MACTRAKARTGNPNPAVHHIQIGAKIDVPDYKNQLIFQKSSLQG